MATQTFKSAYSRQIALWVLRAFSPGLPRARFITFHHDYADDDIANFLDHRCPTRSSILSTPYV
jgi:hypothetical protein